MHISANRREKLKYHKFDVVPKEYNGGRLMVSLTFFPQAGGLIAILFAWYLTRRVMKQNPGNEDMQKVSDATREGAMAYLTRQYKVIAVFVVAVERLLPG